MRFRLTIILVLLNLALFTLLYFLAKGPTGPRSGSSALLAQGVVQGAEKIQIENPETGQEWMIEKRAATWRITSPVLWPANPFAVSRILNQLQFLEEVTRFAVSDIEQSGQSLADFGLDPPKATLTLHHRGAQSQIAIGQGTEVGNRLYVLSPDRANVVVVNRELLDSITFELEAMRSQEIFDIPLFETRSVSLKIGDLPVRIVRDGGGWKFETPVETTADTARVESAINRLTGMRLVDFSEEDQQVHGLESPRMRLTLEGNNRRQTVIIGNRVEDNLQVLRYYAKLADSATVFVLSAGPLSDFFDSLDRLRERQFVQLERDAITSITISAGEQSTQLQKLEQGGWQVPVKDARRSFLVWPADPTVIDGLIEAILGLRAIVFVSDSPSAADLESFGFNHPQRRVAIQAASQQSSILIGDFDGEEQALYVKIEEAPFVYQVEENRLLNLLELRPLHYRLRVLEEQPPSARILSIALTDLQSDELLFSIRSDPPEEEGAKTGILERGIEEALAGIEEPDRQSARLLISQVRKFAVKSFPREQNPEGHQIGDRFLRWRYLLRAQLRLPGGDEAQIRTRQFTFTERIGGTTQIGYSPDHATAFELTQELIDAIFHFAVTR